LYELKRAEKFVDETAAAGLKGGLNENN